nr:MAG TPA: hypothetical protein [Caudoviricetes sp.]
MPVKPLECRYAVILCPDDNLYIRNKTHLKRRQSRHAE